MTIHTEEEGNTAERRTVSRAKAAVARKILMWEVIFLFVGGQERVVIWYSPLLIPSVCVLKEKAVLESKDPSDCCNVIGGGK